MTPRLVTFDLDDTLWDVAPVMRGAEATLRDWLASQAPRLGPLPIEQLWAIRGQLLEAEPLLRFRLSELRRRILLQALRSAGYPDEEAASLAEGAFQAFLAARHRVSFFDDVHSTLEQLARDYTLGVITNGNADIRRLGLADYFRFAVSAEQLGIGVALEFTGPLALALFSSRRLLDFVWVILAIAGLWMLLPTGATQSALLQRLTQRFARRQHMLLADHPLLVQLTEQGYFAFAEQALSERRSAGLPPFCHLALLRAEAHKPGQAESFLDEACSEAEHLLGELGLTGIELLGPVPAPMERRAGRIRAQLLLQSNARAPLHRLLLKCRPLIVQLPVLHFQIPS